MSRGVTLSKVIKIGTSHYLLIPAPVRDRLTWREGDSIAMREAGEKIVLERIQLEKLAILKTGGMV